MTSNVFTRLLGLFVLLLALQALVIEFVIQRFVLHSTEGTLEMLGREALWSALTALVFALPLAAIVAGRISARMRRVVTFAHRIASGDLTARIDATGPAAGSLTGVKELSAVEAALNESAVRLGKDFAELESGRAELAVMLGSMQEAVVAVTAAGFVRWSNAVMQGILGSQLAPGRPLVHFIRDPELLACVRGALE